MTPLGQRDRGDAEPASAAANAPTEGFQTLVDSLNAVVWEADASTLGVTYVSQHAETLFGYPVDRWVKEAGFWESIVHPDDRAEAVRIRRAVVGQGIEREAEYRIVAQDDRMVWIHDLIHVVHDEAGNAAHLRGIMVDVTKRIQSDREIEAEQAVARVLASADSVETASVGVLEAICHSLGWELGCMWTADPAADVLRCEATWSNGSIDAAGFAEDSRGRTFARGTGLPGRVWERAQPAWIPDVVTDGNSPRAPIAARHGLHGAVGFPILIHGVAIGVLEFFTREIRDPVFGLRRTMRAIGNQIGQFIEETEAQRALQESRARLSFLAEASALLSSSLDFRTVLARLASLTIPTVADWCAVDVFEEDGTLARVAVEHTDPAKADAARRLKAMPPDEGRARVLRRALETGEAFLDLDGSEVCAAFDPERRRVLGELGVGSAIVVPLMARGRTLGLMKVVRRPGERVYTSADLTLVSDLARRAALAVDNARLYSERSHVARTLQRSLLPPQLPTIPGVEIAARYTAAGEGNEVGGDFYDLFRTGRDDWAVVIGDVCGKGAEAAALTALARHTLRAASMQARKPSRVLAQLNEALLASTPEHGPPLDTRFCTVSYVRLRPTETGIRITVASGGHPLPYLLRLDGRLETAARAGTVMGVIPEVDLTDRSTRMEPGDVLVLYTDGVTEARGPRGEFGEDGLRDLIASCRGLDASAMAERIERTVLEHQDGTPRDDIALIVLRVTA